MSTWTVVGLIDQDSGELLVAGVFAGKRPTWATQATTGRFERYFRFVEADSAEQAETVACAEVDGDTLGDVDEATLSPEPLWPIPAGV